MAIVLPPAHEPARDAAPQRLLAPDVVDGPSACRSCGAPLTGRFCADCGEKRAEPDDHRLRHVLGEVAEQFLSIDGRAFRTVRALLTKPGFLTAEYLAGRRRLYSKPLSLFVLLNVIFFFAAPYIGLLRYTLGSFVSSPPPRTHVMQMVRARIDQPRPRFDHATLTRQAYGRRVQAYEQRFDVAAEKNKQSLLIFLVPGVAAVAALLEIRRRRTYVEHLVFAVHAVTWLLVFLLAGVPLLAKPLLRFVVMPVYDRVGRGASESMANNMAENWLGLFIALGFALYLYLAIRRVYGDGRMRGAIKAVLLASSFMVLFQMYRSLLFFVTYYSL
jgi:hypothetical protein